jgi:segregation and condensation protein B
VTPLAKLLEAALFASARPIATDELAVLEPDASPAELQSALEELREHYDVDGHGVELQEIGGGWQILTRAEYTEAIERAQLAARPARLSGAALETLAIIAYRQPISRAEIEEIRGVMVGSVLKSLHERGLIDVTGRGEGLGRPLLYGTTPVFLEYFALRHLEELPRADELAIALRVPNRADDVAIADRPDPAERVVDPTEPADRVVAVSSVRADSPADSSAESGDVADSAGLAEASV